MWSSNLLLNKKSYSFNSHNQLILNFNYKTRTTVKKRYNTIAYAKTKVTQKERTRTELKQLIYGLNSVVGTLMR